MQIEVLSPDIVSKKQYFGVTPMPDAVRIRTERQEAGDLTPTNLVSVEGL